MLFPGYTLESLLEELTPVQFFVLLEQGLHIESVKRLVDFRENKLLAMWHASTQSKESFNKTDRVVRRLDDAYSRACGESTTSDDEKIASVVRSEKQ